MPVRLESIPVLLIAALVALSLGCARPKPIPRAEWKAPHHPYRNYKLPNGLLVIAEEDDRSQLASFALAVGAGAAQDPAGKEGLAHLVEHLVFRARPEGKQTLEEILAFSGASHSNAYTTHDVTLFEVVAHRAATPVLAAKVQWILTDALAGLDEATFEAERQVVLSELRRSSHLSGYRELSSVLWAAAFPEGHAYARPIGGTEQTVSKLTLEDARAFVQAHYRPNSATVAIAGGVNPGSFNRQLESRFGPQPQPTARAPAPAEGPAPQVPEPPKQRFHRLSAAVIDPEVHIIWTLPRGVGADDEVNRALVRPLERELNRISREDSDIESVELLYNPGERASLLIATVTLREGKNPNETATLLVSRLEEVISSGGHRRGLSLRDALSPTWISDSIIRSEDALERARSYAIGAHRTGKLWANEKKADGSSVEERLKWVSSARARIVAIHPEASSRYRDGLLHEGGGELRHGAAQSLSVVVPPEELRKFALRADAGKARTVQFENGLEVVILPTGHKGSVSITLSVPGGSSLSDPPGAAILGEWVAFRHDYTQSSSFWAGVSADYFLGKDTRRLTVRGQPHNLRSMLMWLERETDGFEVEAAVLPYLELEVYPRLRRIEERPQAVASRAFWAALYEGHPYGRAITVDDLSSAGDWSVERWLERAHSPRGSILVIAGDVRPEEVEPLVREVFMTWESAGDPVTPPPPASPRAGAPRVIHADVPGAKQVGVSLACLFPQTDEREAVIQELLAQALNEELTRELRGTAGVTYDVSVQTWRMWGGSAHLRVETLVSPEHLQAVLAHLHSNFAVDAAAVSEDAINRARWDVVRTHNLRFLTSDRLSESVARSRRLGLPADALDRLPDQAATATTGEVQATFDRCRSGWVLMLTGAKQMTEPAARASGWQQ